VPSRSIAMRRMELLCAATGKWPPRFQYRG
jgi:hypothetical protein